MGPLRILNGPRWKLLEIRFLSSLDPDGQEANLQQYLDLHQ